LLITTCAVVVAVDSTVPAATIDLSETYSSFVAFGDNLTDDGKLDGTPFEPGLPSFGGRFSNGITYAENIAQDFSFSPNFAIGGATARNENENPLPPAFGTFSGQVASFTGLVADPIARTALGDRPLFSVLFGGNDILQNVGLPPDNDVQPGIGLLAADAIEANIRAINAINGDYNDFVVTTLPDLDQTPLFQNAAFGAGAFAPLVALEVAGFNDRLALNVVSLRSDGINIIEFDLNTAFQQSLTTSELLGIDTETPCSFDLSNPGPGGTCVFAPGSPDNIDMTLADNFFFIDGTNPNRNAHAAFANDFRQAAVPEPTSLSMLMVGFAAFFLRRSRNR